MPFANRVDAREGCEGAVLQRRRFIWRRLAEPHYSRESDVVGRISKALPDTVINSAVMDRMIDHWPLEWSMTFPPSEFRIFNNLDALSVAEIEAMLMARAVIAEGAMNAQRLRHARALVMLNEEMTKRFKAHEKAVERERTARSR